MTQCYEKEMGSRLSKVFYAFEDLWAPGHLVRIKLETNGLETQALRDFDPGRDGRIVNIDPGYVEYAKMVLASAKNGANRIYLEQGIFAESTLYFVDGTFHAWPRTYPDYKTEEYIAFFNELRKRYCEKSRNNREWREPLLFQ